MQRKCWSKNVWLPVFSTRELNLSKIDEYCEFLLKNNIKAVFGKVIQYQMSHCNKTFNTTCALLVIYQHAWVIYFSFQSSENGYDLKAITVITQKCPNKQQTRNEKTNKTNKRKICSAIFWIGMKCLIDKLFIIIVCLM